MIYLLDANAVSDLMFQEPIVWQRASERLLAGDMLALTRPVYFEVLRGIYWRNAANKFNTLQHRILPLLTWIELLEVDWELAARYWANARSVGRQLGDPDLLLAAMVTRLNAVVVSADADFDALPITREDWRSS